MILSVSRYLVQISLYQHASIILVKILGYLYHLLLNTYLTNMHNKYKTENITVLPITKIGKILAEMMNCSIRLKIASRNLFLENLINVIFTGYYLLSKIILIGFESRNSIHMLPLK